MLFSQDKKENDLILVRNQALEYAMAAAKHSSHVTTERIHTADVLSDAEKYLKFLRTA